MVLPMPRRLAVVVLKFLVYLLLFTFALASLLPLYWMFTTAFKPTTLVMAMPPEWFPTNPSLENFRRMFAMAPVWRWTLNSGIVAVTVTVMNLVLDSLAGYLFAKRTFPARDALFWLILSTMMIPAQVTIVPLYIMAARLDLLNTYGGLIWPVSVRAFGIFLMKQYMQTLPSEIIDAAAIDGCGELGTFTRIILPLAKPALAVLAIFIFIGNLNSFLWPMLVTSKGQMRTLPVGLTTLQDLYWQDYGLVIAGAAWTALPAVVLFLLLQKYFLTGLTVGAIKA